MSTLKYCCDVCGKLFDTEELANRCEGDHERPVVEECLYYPGSKYPYTIRTRFSDGALKVYRLR